MGGWERSTGHIVDSCRTSDFRTLAAASQTLTFSLTFCSAALAISTLAAASQMLTFSLTFCSAALAISVLWRLPHKCSQMPHKYIKNTYNNYIQ